MLQLDKVWANARYEIITLLRGWFFRIFAGLVIAIFVFIDIIFFSTATNVPRMFYGLSASAPYANMMMLNLAQIAVVIILASDLFKRDKKLNTTEVFYIRSMTNGAYITGRTIGILVVFSTLNLIVLLIAGIIHFVFGDTNFSWYPYLLFFFLMPLPSLIYTMGLSFFLIRLIKNQAIVVLLLLGYFAAVLFYLHDKWFYLFDFVAINLPIFYSDFVGIANLELFLLQRALYIILGLIFISLTILFFTRLPQSKIFTKTLTGLIAIFTLLSIFCAYQYVNFFLEGGLLRQRMLNLNTEYIDRQNITPESCRIELHHLGNEIEATADISFQNRNNKSIENYYFSLNPSLHVKQVINNHQDLKFQQKDHLVILYPNEPIKSEQRDSIRIIYSGTVNQAACYLDINQENLQDIYNIWLCQVFKKYVFLEDNFLLLSPECMWYPNAVLPVDSKNFEQHQYHFIDFHLTVFTKENLIAISQGEGQIISPGITSFQPEHPLPRLSLVVGPYQQRTISVDSVDYSLFILPEHAYFDEYFTEIGDTLDSIIREARQDYEVKLNLDYPFKRFSLIEVPIQFYTYSRIWTMSREVIQPEQIWLPENAAYLRFADFRQSNNFLDRRLDRSNQTLTETESQTTLLKQFIYNTFLGQSSMGARFGGGPTVENQPDFNPFPNFYSYTNYFQLKNWQIFNSALEAYLFNRVQKESTNPRIALYAEGLTKSEEVSQALTKQSLAELLYSDDDIEILAEVIRAKGAYLFKMIQNEQSIEDFDNAISILIQSNRFQVLMAEEFINQTNKSGKNNIQSMFEKWYHSRQLPGYLISNVEMYKVIDNDRMRYQILFKISNPEEVNGVVEVQFQYGSFRRRMMTEPTGPEEPPRIIKIAAGQSKEIGIVLDTEPRAVNINSLIAWNIPLIFSKQFEKAEIVDNISAFDGERIIQSSYFRPSSDEIIVDNEDEGFIVFNPPIQSFLKRLIHSDESSPEKSFGRFTWWSPATQWTLLKNASFYGKYIHSAYYIKSGTGKMNVTWQTEIPEDGIYDIYSYAFNPNSFNRRRRGGDDGRRSSTGGVFGDFNYTIHHDTGSDQAILNIPNISEGWHFLGAYYFSKGLAKIELSDKSRGRIVVADAVKWVKN